MSSAAVIYKLSRNADDVLSGIDFQAANPTSRKLIREQAAAVFAALSHLTVSKVTLLRAESLGLGDDSVELVLSMKTNRGTFDLGEAWVRVDRGVTALYYGSAGRAVGRSEVRKLLENAVGRMEHELFSPPISQYLPTVFGTPVVGHRLIGTSGGWIRDTATFEYQWERCAGSRSNCVPISNATELTYTVVLADIGSMLALSVTALNASGSTSALSTPTALVRR
jgi:hypothetical protein